MSTVIFYEQDADRELCRLYGDDGDREMILREIDGWSATPESKTETTPRKWGDGDHDISQADIAYGSRTVSLSYRLLAGDRRRLQGLRGLLDGLTHRLVRMRVVDGDEDTFQVGEVLQVLPDKAPQNLATQTETGAVTLLFRRPDRLSWLVRRDQVWPGGGMSGGLSYGSSAAGLAYPLSYGVLPASRDTLLLRNVGSSAAYPVLTLDGDHRGRLLLVWEGRSLEWSGGVGGPVVFDCRTQTVSLGGVDQSRGLVSRAFPSVPPGGSVLVRLVEAGDGWLTVESRDTYI